MRGLKGVLETETEVTFEKGIGEEGAFVVDGVSEGVVTVEGQAGFGELLCADIQLQGVVAREAFIGTAIHTGEASGIDTARTVDGVARGSWIGNDEKEATAALIEIVQRVEVIGLGTDVGDGSDDAMQVVFERGIPLLDAGSAEVVVEHTSGTADEER